MDREAASVQAYERCRAWDIHIRLGGLPPTQWLARSSWREVVITTTEQRAFAIDAIDYILAPVAHWETLKGRPMWQLLGRDYAHVIGHWPLAAIGSSIESKF